MRARCSRPAPVTTPGSSWPTAASSCADADLRDPGSGCSTLPVRLRQGVVVDWELEPLRDQLRSGLGLAEPYADPGVGEFGLRNAVMALGDTFLEVIAPIAESAPARRRLERHGPGGYMLIVQVDDGPAARRRADDAGGRIVWQADLPDISGTHLHPADVGGTL